MEDFRQQNNLFKEQQKRDYAHARSWNTVWFTRLLMPSVNECGTILNRSVPRETVPPREVVQDRFRTVPCSSVNGIGLRRPVLKRVV